MSAYLLVDITVHDAETYKEYIGQVPPFIAKHQGSYLVRGGNPEVKEGDWDPRRIVIVEFPSREHAESFIEDPEYQPIAAIRHAATTTNMVLVDGK